MIMNFTVCLYIEPCQFWMQISEHLTRVRNRWKCNLYFMACAWRVPGVGQKRWTQARPRKVGRRKKGSPGTVEAKGAHLGAWDNGWASAAAPVSQGLPWTWLEDQHGPDGCWFPRPPAEPAGAARCNLAPPLTILYHLNPWQRATLKRIATLVPGHMRYLDHGWARGLPLPGWPLKGGTAITMSCSEKPQGTPAQPHPLWPTLHLHPGPHVSRRCSGHWAGERGGQAPRAQGSRHPEGARSRSQDSKSPLRAPLSHGTSLAKHKPKGKIIKSLKKMMVEHYALIMGPSVPVKMHEVSPANRYHKQH